MKTILKTTVAVFAVAIIFTTTVSLTHAFFGGMGGMERMMGKNSTNIHNEEWSEQREHMNTMKNVIHSSKFESNNIANGVEITVEGNNDELISDIQEELVTHNDELKDYFETYYKNVELKIEKTDKGVKFTVTSTEEETIEGLQKSGSWTILSFFMKEMHELMHGSNGMMGGMMKMMHGDNGMKMMEGNGMVSE